MDSSFDPSKLNAADRKEVTQFLANEGQKANIQQMSHQLADTCWKKCITGKISSPGLERNEESCTQNCVNRWMDANLAVAKAFEQMRGGQ